MEEKLNRINEILESLGEPFRVEYKAVNKNNEVLSGLVLTGKTACPTIYVDDEMFLATPDDEIIKELADTFATCNLDFDSRYIEQDYILANVYPKIIGSNNLHWVEEGNYMYKKFLDLIILFYVIVGDEDGQMLSYTLMNSHVKGLRKGDIYGTAISNLRKSTDVFPMERIFREMIGETDDVGNDMWIFTNKWRVNGAAVILIDDLLNDFASTVNEDFIILPSSVHEVIALPFASTINAEDLYSMVCEINSTTIDPKDKLTDNVYIYDGSLRAYK